MIVLIRTFCGKQEYLKRVGSFSGQPTAQGCTTLDDARKFRTKEEAEKFIAKYTGIGAGIERFQAIHIS